MESGIHWKVHLRVRNNKSDNSAEDHTGEHKGCHKVTRLHQKPHRKDSGKKDVGKYQISPGCFACYKRYIHADCKSCNGACKAEYHSFQPFHCSFFWSSPKTTAKAINSREMLPAAPFTVAWAESFVTPSTVS